MLTVKCSVQSAITVLNESKGYVPQSLETNLLMSLFQHIFDYAPLEDVDLILTYLEQHPSLIEDFLNCADKWLEPGYADCIIIEQVYYMRLCELVLQRCDEELLIQFLRLLTCTPGDNPSMFLNLDCWNTMLSYELKDLIAYDLEEYKIVNYQAKRIILINKALSAIIDE